MGRGLEDFATPMMQLQLSARSFGGISSPDSSCRG
jgi:hypothetical protein